MTPPSFVRKLRMHPTLSEGQLCSMRLSAISGCHRGSPLKSRTSSQTASAGASITLEA
jgi:hypothetical protein